MEITHDTELSEILNHTDVAAITSTMNSIRSTTQPRREAIWAVRDTDAIKNGLVDGQNIMFTTANAVDNDYGVFHDSLETLIKSISETARAKEEEELNELIKAIDKQVEHLKTLRTGRQTELRYVTPDDKEVEEELRALIAQYNSQITSYEDKKDQAIARLSALGIVYQDPNEQPQEETKDEPDSAKPEEPLPPEELSHDGHTEYKLTTGDEVVIDGQQCTFEFLAVDLNGNKRAYYADGDGNVFYIDSNGNRTDTEYNAVFGYAHHVTANEDLMLYQSYQTSNENASQMHLPSPDTITTPTGEYVDVIDPNDIDTYVDYGQPNTADVTHANNSTELHEAAANHAPVITVDATQLEDNQSGWQNFIGGSNDVDANEGATQITLVYNETTGKYYPLNNDGTYEMDMYCELTPEKLQSFTIEN